MPQTNGHAANGGGPGLRGLVSWLSDRIAWSNHLGYGHQGRRDYYTTYGYDKSPTYEKYMARYRRQDLARRIVDLPATGTWQQPPTVSDDADTETDTEFEQAWKEMADRIGLYDAYERADKLAGIGRFSLVLLGAPGELASPLEGLSGPDSVVYATAYGEGSIMRIDLDADRTSPRFGLPAWYEIDLNFKNGDPRPGLTGAAISWFNGLRGPATVRVHWTRTIHVAENLLEDRILGAPRLEAVYNLLDDLMKVVGGAAEGFYRIARPIIHADVERDYPLTKVEEEEFQGRLDAMIHEMRQYLLTRSIEVKALGMQAADPRGAFSVILDLIAGATGIPQRVLLGSERGELSSAQDERNFNRFLEQRRARFAGPMMVRPTAERLIQAGALPRLRGMLKITWPDLMVLGQKEKAEIANLYGQAIQRMASMPSQQFPNTVVSHEELRERFLDLPPTVPEQIQVPEWAQRQPSQPFQPAEDTEHG